MVTYDYKATLDQLIAAGVRKAEFNAQGYLTMVEFRDPEPPPPEKQTEPQGSGFTDEVDAALGHLASRGKKAL